MIQWIKDFFQEKDRLRKEVNYLKAENDDIRKNLSVFGQILKDIQKEIEGDLIMQQVNNALDEAIDDMFWVKDIDGKYIIANKSICTRLLFDENPIGKTDVELATAQIKRVGEENHTFGKVCANSDLIVLNEAKPMKFNEDGIVNGKYMMLQVNKNVFRDDKGMIAGTVGIGRDITYETEAIRDIMTTTKDKGTEAKLQALLDHYAYRDRS